mmetsp:Transcript_6289/g.11478  ORF Transcript_6289/g.11478 Transcript_6289/m.11478 type:complete len:102 (-) Transcript_6289:528-833(-)
MREFTTKPPPCCDTLLRHGCRERNNGRDRSTNRSYEYRREMYDFTCNLHGFSMLEPFPTFETLLRHVCGKCNGGRDDTPDRSDENRREMYDFVCDVRGCQK